MILALDTATRHAGLAIYDGENVRVEMGWYHPKKYHTERLVPTIQRAFAEVEITADALTGVAVTTGPGSFTGLRVALSVAKGLVTARRIALLGIPTLAVAAYPHVAEGRRLCVCMSVGRGKFTYEWHTPATVASPAAPVTPPVTDLAGLLTVLGEVAADDTQPLWLTGEFTLAEREAVAVALPQVYIVPPALAARRAAFLAEMAFQRLQAGQQDDPHTLEPFYLYTQ